MFRHWVHPGSKHSSANYLRSWWMIVNVMWLLLLWAKARVDRSTREHGSRWVMQICCVQMDSCSLDPSRCLWRLLRPIMVLCAIVFFSQSFVRMIYNWFGRKHSICTLLSAACTIGTISELLCVALVRWVKPSYIDSRLYLWVEHIWSEAWTTSDE